MPTLIIDSGGSDIKMAYHPQLDVIHRLVVLRRRNNDAAADKTTTTSSKKKKAEKEPVKHHHPSSKTGTGGGGGGEWKYLSYPNAVGVVPSLVHLPPSSSAAASGGGSGGGQPSRRVVGKDLRTLRHYHGLLLRRPMQQGLVVDAAMQAALWEQGLQEVGITDEAAVDVVVTTPHGTPSAVCHLYQWMCFERFQFRTVLFTSTTFLSLFDNDEALPSSLPPPVPTPRTSAAAAARSDVLRRSFGTGIVVDSGFSATTVVAYANFKPLKRTIQQRASSGRTTSSGGGVIRIDVGGKLLTNRLKEIVCFTQMNLSTDTWLVNVMKERMCYVAPHFRRVMELNSQEVVRDLGDPENVVNDGFVLSRQSCSTPIGGAFGEAQRKRAALGGLKAKFKTPNHLPTHHYVLPTLSEAAPLGVHIAVGGGIDDINALILARNTSRKRRRADGDSIEASESSDSDDDDTDGDDDDEEEEEDGEDVVNEEVVEERTVRSTKTNPSAARNPSTAASGALAVWKAKDAQILKFRREPFVVAELLFSPSDVGLEQCGVDVAVYTAAAQLTESLLSSSPAVKEEETTNATDKATPSVVGKATPQPPRKGGTTTAAPSPTGITTKLNPIRDSAEYRSLLKVLLSSTVLLTGGTANMTGFAHRLSIELSAAAPSTTTSSSSTTTSSSSSALCDSAKIAVAAQPEMHAVRGATHFLDQLQHLLGNSDSNGGDGGGGGIEGCSSLFTKTGDADSGPEDGVLPSSSSSPSEAFSFLLRHVATHLTDHCVVASSDTAVPSYRTRVRMQQSAVVAAVRQIL